MLPASLRLSLRQSGKMRTLLGAILAAVLAATRGWGQGPSGRPDTVRINGARLGDTVQVTLRILRSGGSSEPLQCTGHVLGVRVDTLRIGGVGYCSDLAGAGGNVTALRIRQQEGSRGTHAVVGFAIGAVSGAVLGQLFGPKCVLEGPCASSFPSLGFTEGLVLGGFGGLVVGLLRDAGEQWLEIPVPSVVRLTGLNVHPGIRVHANLGR